MLLDAMTVHVYNLWSGMFMRRRRFRSEQAARDYAHVQRMKGFAAVAVLG